MFQPLLDVFIESASIKKKIASKSPPPKNRCGELVWRR